MTDIAANNPDDTTIADKLADAKQQLADAQDALSTATDQKAVIENADTPAEVTAAQDKATEAATAGDTAQAAADNDVTDAQTQSDKNLADAKTAAMSHCKTMLRRLLMMLSQLRISLTNCKRSPTTILTTKILLIS